MIQGLMHVLNELRRHLPIIRTYEHTETDRLRIGYEDLERWIQGEIDREIDDLAEYHSESERKDVYGAPRHREMTDQELSEREGAEADIARRLKEKG